MQSAFWLTLKKGSSSFIRKRIWLEWIQIFWESFLMYIIYEKDKILTPFQSLLTQKSC